MNERSWSRKLWHRNWKWKHTRKLNVTILPSLFPKISVTFSSKTIQTNVVSKQAFKYINTLLGSICWCVDHRCGLGGSVTMRFRWWPNCFASSDVTPVVSDDVERSRPHAHSRNLLCQISGDQGRRFLLSHTEIRVNIRANGGFKPPQVFVGRSRGPSCPISVRAITSASH